MTNNDMAALHETAASSAGVPLGLWPKVMPELERSGLVEQRNGRWFITGKGKRVAAGWETAVIVEEVSLGPGSPRPEYKGMPPEAVRAFQRQRTNARTRGIEFLFTFEEWWAWWQMDNRWERRGVRKGQLAMARFKDEGPYHPNNVYCATREENLAHIPKEKMRSGWARRYADGKTASKPHLGRRGELHPKSRQIQTPAGVFGSAALAGEHHGISRQHAAKKAREGAEGWRYIDDADSSVV